MLQDVRFACRQMLKTPSFSVVAILTLALAVGANTAIFSAIDALLLHPLPYPQPERLVSLTETLKKFDLIRIPVSPLEYHDLRDLSTAFAQVGADASGAFTLTGRGAAEAIPGIQITANLFTMLGVRPLTGGLFTSAEETFGRHRVVVISERFWRQRFAADPAVAGKTLELNRETYQVVGVIRPILQHRGGLLDLYVPLTFRPADLIPAMRNRKSIDVLARLKPGVTPVRANAELAALALKLTEQYPSAYPSDYGFSLEARPLAENVAGDLRTPLLVLIAAVGVLMLIACANVSSLLLARAIVRRKEITIRAAIGADRGRLTRQLLSESLTLAGAAALLGLTIAAILLQLYAVYGPGEAIRVSGLALNGWVAAFAIALSAFASMVFGLVPAMDAARVDLNEALKEGTRGSSGPRRRMRQVLVALEVAMSVVLLAGAGVMGRSFLRLVQTNPGFQTANVLTFQLALPAEHYREEPKRSAMFNEVAARLRALPGVISAGAVDPLPFTGGNNGSSIAVVGRPQNAGEPQPIAGTRRILPGYFAAMGIPLLAGRRFVDADTVDAPLAVIVDAGVARHYFPNQNPVGQQITGATKQATTIVGVVGAVKQLDLAEPAQMAVYYPADQFSGLSLWMVVKTATDPFAILPAVRRAVAGVDSNVPVSRVATMEQRLSDSLARRRIAVELMMMFAAMAALLAAIGIYGVLSYLVDQRRRELAIRMALGASAGQVIRLVAWQGAWPVLAGMVAGLAGAYVATRWLQTLLYQVSPDDPVVFGSVIGLLGLVALLAVAVPVRKATRVDPAVALREE